MVIREAMIRDAAAICHISSKDLGYECEESFVKERLEKLDSSRLTLSAILTLWLSIIKI